MKLKTEQGVLLHVSVGWSKHYPQQPSIEFRFDNQQLCTIYFVSTFQAITEGQGICLDGGTYSYKSISAEQVAECQGLIERSLARLI